MTLFRHGKLTDRGQTFWTPEPRYVWHCKSKAPNLQATLRRGARVRRVAGPARGRVICNAANRRNWDVLVFEAWDWGCDEYVILNQDALKISRISSPRRVARK